MPRILVLHATVGTGHKRAAEALAAALRLRQPGEVRVEDTLDYTPRLFRVAYTRSYLELSERAPMLWGLYYSQSKDDPDWSELTNNFRRLVEGLSTSDLKSLLESFQPDVIICTHFLPLELLADMKRRGRLTRPVHCIVTDFTAHTFWIYPSIDGYYVASDLVRTQLVQAGVPPQVINVSGIPIDIEVMQPKEQAAMRAAHDLPTEGVVITLFGGGVLNENIRTIAAKLLASDLAGMLLIATGRNETLREALAPLEPGPTLDLRVLGHIDFVDDLIVASDLVISKSGGLIVSEVLARGRPMIVIDPILGHEEWNADYVVSSGAGLHLRIADAVAPAVRHVLKTPALHATLAAGATAAGWPRAARAIADDVVHVYYHNNKTPF